MKSARFKALAILCAIVLSGCDGASPPAKGPKITVAAASDLQQALPILAARFTLDTGIEVAWTLGSSGTLAEQIKQGAPYDLFLSANRGFVDGLEKAGVVDASTIRPYAQGTLAMVVGKDRSDLKSIADLDRTEVKSFALANPTHAPYGLAAMQVLEKAKLWDKLEPKRVLASNVREALQFVESGNTDAAFVGTALARGSKLRIIPIHPDDHKPIIQFLAVVRKPGSTADAERFAAFLTGDVGRGIFGDMGFSTIAAQLESLAKDADAR